MKKTKKVLSIVLSLTLLLSAFAGVDFSAYALAKSGKCGKNVSYEFNSSTGELTISGKGDMDDYESSSPFRGNTKIKTVAIKKGVTRIGWNAFNDCKEITSVSIGNSVEIVNDCSFANCSKLKSIKFPDKVLYIGYHAFVNCTGLKKAIFGSDTVTINDGSFENCTGLSSVIIGKKVEYIGGDAFLNCKKIKDVYYAGSKKQWKAIEIGSNNEWLKKATIHYNSPYPTSISKLTGGKKAFTVKWKKQTKNTTGYEIQYSTSSSFKSGNKTVTVSKNSTTSKTVKKLKAKKKYYVRIRTYKNVNGKKYYSAWSAKKSITTKK